MKKAFTLLETILTIVITVSIVLVVQGSFATGIRLYRQINQATTAEAHEIFDIISRDIAASIPNSSVFFEQSFVGAASSLRFIATEKIGFSDTQSDLKQVRLYLVPAGTPGTYSLRYGNDPFPLVDRPGKVLDTELSLQVTSLRLGYYDGSEWKNSWNNALQLPQQVSLSIEFSQTTGKATEKYSTIIGVPCASLNPDGGSDNE